MRAIILACAAILVGFVPATASASEMTGIWMTSGGKSRVELKPCAQHMCANIVWLQQPNDANGNPLRDRRNEADELRDRPVMGILVLKVAQTDQNRWEGRVYDPERGKTYPATVGFVADGVLKVTGCGLGGLVCKSKNWQKVGEIETMEASPMPRN